MRRLILMRHAKSDWNAGLEDHERPLNERGKGAATALGKWLRGNGFRPDEVLSSSATRTRQTLSRLKMSEDIPIRLTRDLYLAEAEDMLAVLRRSEVGCVLMLGHNPGVGEMAGRLVDDPPAHPGFCNYPTGATLVVDFDAEAWQDVGWHDGQPADFTVPRDLP